MPSLHFLQVHERERVYTVCYISFTMFMIGTMIIATRLPFNYDPDPQESQNPATVSSPNEVRVFFQIRANKKSNHFSSILSQFL